MKASNVFVGVDLGKVCSRVVAFSAAGPGVAQEHLVTFDRRHFGDPFSVFFEAYRTIGSDAIRGIVATGVYSHRLRSPVVSALPEEIALEWAVRRLAPESGPLTVVRIGGSGFSVLARTSQGHFQYEKNDRCSAGTGETIERICARLGATLEEAASQAESAQASIPITARCSVFAKSELTHFANQGEPHDRLFRGYFESIAKNIHSLVEKAGVPGPVWIVGHGALIRPLVRALGERLRSQDNEREIVVPPEAPIFEALGALEYALAQCWEGTEWPADPGQLVAPERRYVRSLHETGLANREARVVHLTEPDGGEATPVSPSAPTVLGLDLGSTGSKAALITLDTGKVVADVYRRTDGNPVEAARALVAEMLEKAPNPIYAVGLTGSGRDAAATVFRAALGDAGSRLLVQNEIVAHAVAAARYDPDGGRSLSIVEIGGQDAKFINVRGGAVLDSDMNRACSAGTGSFLEEQAVLYGVDDIVRFGEMAGTGENPPDLGQMCTVFVADKAADALNDGYSLSDVFAGFQYAVVRNYKNRVMGNRQFLDRIFFQGKPASSDSLAQVLSRVTGREVCVPPNPGAMGAIGIALLARQALGALDGARPLDLSPVLKARVVERRTFRCQDRTCQNLCRIESAAVEVGGERRRVVSGGSCPKYDAVSTGARKLPKDAPNPFLERRRLLEELLADVADQSEACTPAVGLPCGHYTLDLLPFLATFLQGMGFGVELIWPDAETLAAGDKRCTASGACAPVKLVHGLARADLPFLFLPIFVTLPRGHKHGGAATCPMAQGTPEMVERALAAEGATTKVLRPVVRRLDSGLDSTAFAAEWISYWMRMPEPGLRRPLTVAWQAFKRAVKAQQRFEQGLREIGERALSFCRREGYPAVVVVGETHIALDAAMNSSIPDLVTEAGAVAIPVDCFPIPEDMPPLARVHWAPAARSLRAAGAAARSGDVFPLLIGAYGCGPGSFVEHMFNDILQDYPHTILETDGHVGKAGYVTRVQAFLHAVRSHLAKQKQRDATQTQGCPSERLRRYDRFPERSFTVLLDRKVVFGTVGGRLGSVIAAMLRGFGVDASFSGESDPEVLRLAQEGCTGKECLPYQMIWGSFASFLTRQDAAWFRTYERPPLLLSVGLGFQSCRANVFHLAEEIAAEKLGLPGTIEVSDLTIIMRYPPLTAVAWAAVVAVDLIEQLATYHLATEREAGSSRRLRDYYLGLLEKVLARPLGQDHWAEVGGQLRRIRRVLERAGEAFAALPHSFEAGERIRDVYLCGDIFLRVNEWSNDRLHERLSAQGLRVQFEPFAELFEILALRETQDHPLWTESWWKYQAFLPAMNAITRWLLAAVQPLHPWLQWFNVRETDRESRRLFCGYPFGESIPTIGSALLAWKSRPIDGVIVVGPRGCGPALLSEAHLRRVTGIPILFIYNDGDPIDEARLAGFAWRLRSLPARRQRFG